MTGIDLAHRFREQGYVKLDGFFTGEEIVRLDEEIHSARDNRTSRLDRAGLTFDENIYGRSEYARQFVSQQRIVDLLRPIVGPGFWIRWDQYVRKVPGGAEFPWHQDNGYNRIRDAHFQLWIAITEGTERNGGLWLRPGPPTQRLPHRRVGNHLVCDVDPAERVFMPAEPGDVVLFSSLLPHYTGLNETDADRCAYVVEYMSLDQYDPLLRPPYFVVAENGQRVARFDSTYPGRERLANRLRYLPLVTAHRLKALVRS